MFGKGEKISPLIRIKSAAPWGHQEGRTGWSNQHRGYQDLSQLRPCRTACPGGGGKLENLINKKAQINSDNNKTNKSQATHFCIPSLKLGYQRIHPPPLLSPNTPGEHKYPRVPWWRYRTRRRCWSASAASAFPATIKNFEKNKGGDFINIVAFSIRRKRRYFQGGGRTPRSV